MNIFRLPSRALGVLAALVLAGCAAVGPQYTKPAAKMPASFVHAPATNQAPMALDQWWTQFDDPELTRIIERVLAQNLDLEASVARIAQARAAAGLSQAALLPRGEAQAQAAAQHQSVESPLGKIASAFPGYDRNLSVFDVGAGASWEIDLAGGLRRAREADLAEFEAARADGLGVRVSVAAEAADAYFRVRGAQARLQLAQAQIDNDGKLLELVTLRQQEGLATRREQSEAEARLAQVRAQLPPLRTELDVQRNRLDVLMGAHPGTYAAGFTAPRVLQALPDIGALPAPESLLRRRPDVIAAERHLAASSARIGVATAEYYPKVSLSALLGFEGLNTAALNSRTFQPQAAAGLRWRLFDFGRVDAEVARAQGANAEALVRYRQAMIRATEDVENALVRKLELDARRRELQHEIAAESEARDLAQEAYTGGATNLIEVIDQDRQLLDARDALALAEADTARATVAVYRSLGGGW